MNRIIIVTVVLVACAFPSALVYAESASATTQPTVAPTLVKDADAMIRAKIRDQWSKVERRLWQIEYKPIEGDDKRSSWHVKGTIWWVALYPSVFKLDELDQSKVYELDGTAVDQNYGVIAFYIYAQPKKVSP